MLATLLVLSAMLSNVDMRVWGGTATETAPLSRWWFIQCVEQLPATYTFQSKTFADATGLRFELRTPFAYAPIYGCTCRFLGIA